MSDTPDDIRATAERIMEKASGEDLCEYIIAVLMDERTRCAQLVENRITLLRGLLPEPVRTVFDALPDAIRNPNSLPARANASKAANSQTLDPSASGSQSLSGAPSDEGQQP